MGKWPIAAIILFLPSLAFGANIPKLEHRVTDLAGVLGPDQRDALDAKLEAHEKATSDQIVILIVKSLEGLDRDAYSQKVFDLNKIGVKGKDNGALLLQSVGERQIRITTGRGLEGALPDGKCGEIRDAMIPYLKSGNYFQAYQVATDQIIAAIKAGQVASTQPASASTGGTWVLVLVGIGVLGIVIALIIWWWKREDEWTEVTPLSTGYTPDYSSYSPTVFYGSSGGGSSSRSSSSSSSSSSYSSSSSSDSGSSWGSSSDSGSSFSSFDGGGGCSDGGGAGGSY